MSNTSSNGGGGYSSTEIVHQGWLTKSPPSKAIFKPRWRRRWFILRSGPFPSQYLLEYFTDESCKRLKGTINLDECEQLGLSTSLPPPTPFALLERHKYTFSLRIPHRVYYLAADTEAEMSKWISCLCQICGLKTADDESDGSNKPPDENNRPTESEENQNNLDSDESSPTLSTVSGPYIPISECFTGKPIKFNDKGSDRSEYYNSSVFAFPPKVNWSTYPRKVSVNAKIVTSSVPPVAPPRPPKTIPGISVTASPTLEKDSLTPIETRSVFTYDNLDEQDSSSTSSSLQSPAGPLYTNLPDLNTPGLTPGSLNSSSSISSSADANGSTPPKVNRNLKPDLNKSFDGTSPRSPFETTGKSQRSLDSSANIDHRRRNGSMDATFPSYRKDGSMTLPSRYNSRATSSTGPAIDRSRKPPDSPITLGPTPAQLKSQNDQNLRTTRHNNSHYASNGSTKNIPSHSSGRRLMGPVISPSEKKPVFHEYEQPAELIGAYLQIDTKSLSGGGSEGKINTFKASHRKPNGLHSVEDSSVEYKLIDPVKTKALNQMIQEREQQLGKRTPVNKNLNVS